MARNRFEEAVVSARKDARSVRSRFLKIHVEARHGQCQQSAGRLVRIIGFGVLMYVLMDGFVLGIGILAPFAEDDAQLDRMMNTAAPIWDGNETWLVLGGAGLLAAFPKAYAMMLSGCTCRCC